MNPGTDSQIFNTRLGLTALYLLTLIFISVLNLYDENIINSTACSIFCGI